MLAGWEKLPRELKAICIFLFALTQFLRTCEWSREPLKAHESQIGATAVWALVPSLYFFNDSRAHKLLSGKRNYTRCRQWMVCDDVNPHLFGPLVAITWNLESHTKEFKQPLRRKTNNSARAYSSCNISLPSLTATTRNFIFLSSFLYLDTVLRNWNSTKNMLTFGKLNKTQWRIRLPSTRNQWTPTQ